MKKIILPSLEKELVDDRLNYTELAAKYSITRPTVRAIAKRIGVHKGNTKRLKNHTLNINYFDKIDTEYKAYILGFIYADGCNTRSGLQIGIQAEDVEALNLIRSELNISNLLRYVKPFKTGWKAKYELSIKSIDFSKKLTDVGCPPAKSLILKFPDFIQEDLIPHFIRGYFDGDGCIATCSRGYYRLGFASGSEEFIMSLKNYIDLKCGIDIKLYKSKRGYYSLNTSKQDHVASIIKLMYADSTFSLQRKHKKAYALAVEKGGRYLIPASKW